MKAERYHVRPLLVVPGLFCTEIHDQDLGYVWGRFRQLYWGPPIGAPSGLRGKPGRILRGLPLPFGQSYDLIGALERALLDGGYRLGETLHFFAYDWRQPVVDLGVALAAEARRIAAASGQEIDMLGLSNGGPILRAAYAADAALPVERVVTSGGAHAGTVETLACFHAGFRFAPLGRKVTPEEFMSCPGGLDSIPGPAWAKFLPEDAGYDLYDVDTWRRLRLSVFRRDPDDPTWVDIVTRRLAGVRQLYDVLGRAAPPRRLVCICGTGIPTQTHVVVENERPRLPGEGRLAGLPPAAIGDGDGAIPTGAAHDWAGADPEIVRVPVTRHRDMIRTPAVFQAILTALR
ncbi:MAG TPA: hypothetical protein VHG72_11345 [Polyangia bacterium]|nr:hypothetical protein [Polyangia bacterium]